MSSSRKNNENLFLKLDIPPPVTEAAQHAISPILNHDERARFNFEASLYKVISKELSPGNEAVYKARVKPAFEAAQGHPPESRHDVRQAMNADPFHNFWGALRRNTMEMRQVNGQFMTLRQLDDLAARADMLNAGSDRLTLDPSIKIPAYVAEVDHHCMPGSYHRELVDGDISPAANYDTGFFVTTTGSIGGLCDAAGHAIAEWIKTREENFTPKTILDIGSAVGNSLVPIANAFPKAAVTAIDVSAPMLRYAHARATSLGANNIHFRQMSGEDLSAFKDGEFNIVMTSIFLHELSSKALPKIMHEMYRVLKKGGLMIHLEQPQYNSDMPIFEQFMRDWDSYNNNEPFWSAMHNIDLTDLMHELGFDANKVWHASMAGPSQKVDDAPAEDHGRAAAWHAYVGQK